jgi:putative peptide zinc metalloprotease protein
MATLSDSLVSSSARSMPVRMRPDLTAKQQRYHGRSYWVVKDPVGLNYFRFQDEEWAILQMIDGTRSLDEIKDKFEEDFPPQKITLEELQQFLGMLHRSGLILAGVPGQGRQLRKRRDERRRKEILAACTNILCIRFKGIDPERALNWLYPWVRWLFSPITLTCCLLLALSALSLVLAEFDTFREKLPAFRDFFTPANAILLAITLGVTKVLHELGHGMSCKHFGGECHEIGIMILVLTPCLYCNVSDSWMLPNKWHRAFIGAAGIFVEVTLASIATFIWWFTAPGLVHYLCLNVMFISSVSTIMFNANPLLRYDGYYILSDVVEIPNLRQKATSILSRKMGEWCLGLEPTEDPFLPERNQVFFALYTVAAVIYRWFILASILFFLYKVFEPYGLAIVGRGIAAMSIYGLLFQPIYQLGKFFYVPGRIHKVKKPRMFATLAVIAAAVAAVLFLPLPHSVLCTLEIQARDAASVFVTAPGTLEEISVEPGQHVEKGDRLARLESIELELEILQLKSQRDQYAIRLENVQRQSISNPAGGMRIGELEDSLETIENQLANKLRDLARLQLQAPIAGTVLPPPWTPRRESGNGQLTGWHGTPLEPRNLGAYLEAKPPVLFCQIGDPEKGMEANLVIDQSDIDFIKEGQDVEIKLDELPHDTLQGTIDEIAKIDLKVSPRNLSAKMGGELATETDASGVERPLNTSYQVRVFMDDPEGLLRLGLRGRAKVHTAPQTLGRRAWRIVAETFNFVL